MEGTLKYTVIKSEKQYHKYCDILEELLSGSRETDEIELLEALIKIYDDENAPLLANAELDSVELLKALMAEHRMTGRQLAKLLDVSEGLVSDMLNHKKAVSKASAKILSAHFKLQPDAFLKPFAIIKTQRA